MSDAIEAPERPPYGAALLVTLVVLAGYVASLAPTVTFWDAGEFIAATRILGIPHPPGTPLFVLMGHAWATLLPIGAWAYRTNLMSATFSAAGAGLWFLVVHESLRGGEGGDGGEGGRSWTRLAGAGAAAIIGAFSFTNWQNSNETEVYAVGTFMIAASCWLALRWRAARGTRRAPVYLLLIVYLQGLSVANHLLALLVGPAVIGFIIYTIAGTRAPDPLERRHEWAKLAAMAGIWALLIGTGLGNIVLLVLGALCFAAAAAFAFTAGAGGFAAVALLLAAVGVSPYLYLFIRSGQHPMVNEAAPATWDALLAVIRRAQYPPRGPLDDPTVLHGPGNPGRSLTIIWLQIQNYFLYWLWQFGKSSVLAVQAVVFAAFLGLGVRGSLALRRNDRGVWWLLLLLWLVTGAGLVAYMNFKPGFSLGYAKDLFPDPGNHEVRERDYFFVVSFVVWGLWAGIGLWSLVKGAARRQGGRAAGSAALALFLLALVPPILNWREASRSAGADRTLAADLSYNLLNSVPPYGILFTYGDNDTFPLWWAQEVAGIRQDVTVVCLALAQTDWYMRQLRDNPIRDFDEAAAPSVWQGLRSVKPSWPLHTMTDAEVRSASTSPILIDSTMALPIGPIVATLKAQTVLYPNDIVSLRIIQQNLGRRAVVWSLTTGDSYEGLRDYVVQQAMGFRLATARPDSTQPGISLGGIGNVAVDMPLTQRLAWDTYRYGALLSGTTDRLESTAASMASSLSIPFTILAYHADAVGDTAAVVKNLERAQQIAPNEAIESALRSYKSHLLPAPPIP